MFGGEIEVDEAYFGGSDRTVEDATVYTDGHRAYQGLLRNRGRVERSVGELVRGKSIDQRRGVVLGDAHARISGCLPQDEP